MTVVASPDQEGDTNAHGICCYFLNDPRPHRLDPNVTSFRRHTEDCHVFVPPRVTGTRGGKKISSLITATSTPDSISPCKESKRKFFTILQAILHSSSHFIFWQEGEGISYFSSFVGIEQNILHFDTIYKDHLPPPPALFSFLSQPP